MEIMGLALFVTESESVIQLVLTRQTIQFHELIIPGQKSNSYSNLG